MSRDELIKNLCPTPDQWRAMEVQEFHERVGLILGYLLERDQAKGVMHSTSSFLGGILGGFLAFLTSIGVRG